MIAEPLQGAKIMSNPVVIHSKLGFSSRKRWRECPASVALSVDMPDKTSSAAAEGTIAHTVAEFYVRQAFKLPNNAGGEAPLMQPPADLDLKGRTVAAWNEELRKHGRAYVEFIRSLIPAHAAAHLVVEQKVSIPSISPHLFGTGDLFVWVPANNLLIAVDYKYGFEDVSCGDDTDTNPQLAAYLVAAAETFKLAPEWLVAAIYQPRRVIGQAGQSINITGDWLAREREKLRAEVARVEAPAGAMPTPGNHCRYCRAKPVCPRVHEAVAAAVATYAGETNLHTMTDDEVVQLWACRSAFKGFWEDVQARIDGLSKTGHKRLNIKTSDGRRKWRDESEVALTLMALGLTDLLAPKALSEVYDRLPANIRDTLVGRTLPVRTITLIEPGTPNETAKLFKKYSRIVDERVKTD
jgi:hypothetical protein